MDANALDDVCVRMPQDLPTENAVWRFFARQDGHRLGHPHTRGLYFLLGNHLVDA